MSLKEVGIIDIPDSTDTLFDHGAFEPRSRRVFVAHTARNSIEVIDHDAGRHLSTLPGFPEAAGVVADEGQVLITNRGAARLAWIDAHTLETRYVLDTGPRPNGVAIISRLKLAVVACLGDETHSPVLQVLNLKTHQRWAIDLPGRPRWCVIDSSGTRVFLAIQEPSMVLVARVPELDEVQHWKLPSSGAHGIDIDHRANREKCVASGRCPEFRTQRSSIQQAALYMSQLVSRGWSNPSIHTLVRALNSRRRPALRRRRSSPLKAFMCSRQLTAGFWFSLKGSKPSESAHNLTMML